MPLASQSKEAPRAPRKFKINSLSGIPGRLSLRSSSALVFVLLFGCIGAYVLQVSHAATKPFELVSVGECMDAPTLDTTARPVIAKGCSGAPGQAWRFLGGTITNEASADDYCIIPQPGAAPTAGTGVYVKPCRDTTARWSHHFRGLALNGAQAYGQPLCITMVGKNNTLILAQCMAINNQAWTPEIY
jgi:hypothetical protein